MAERTCRHRAEYKIWALGSGPPSSPGAAIRRCTGERRVGVRCTGAHLGGGDIHILHGVNLRICWDSFLKRPEEGVPSSNPGEGAKQPFP